jgi:hypothetical protein
MFENLETANQVQIRIKEEKKKETNLLLLSP